MQTPNFQRRKVDNVPPVVAYKWCDGVLDEGYIPFPKRLLRCLTPLMSDMRDLQVVLAVVDYARPNLSRPPSYDYLAFNAGMTAQDFKDRVAQMQAKGWVSATGTDDAVSIRIDGLLKAIEMATEDGSRADIRKGQDYNRPPDS